MVCLKDESIIREFRSVEAPESFGSGKLVVQLKLKCEKMIPFRRAAYQSKALGSAAHHKFTTGGRLLAAARSQAMPRRKGAKVTSDARLGAQPQSIIFRRPV